VIPAVSCAVCRRRRVARADRPAARRRRRPKELRQWQVGFEANEAELLPDGNLLVAGQGTVAELDQGGATVWQQPLKYAGHGFRCGR